MRKVACTFDKWYEVNAYIPGEDTIYKSTR
jgi:hypothetical protein